MSDKKLDEIISRIRQVIEPEKIILFGSRVNGLSNEDSDYDLLIVKSDLKHRRQTAIKIHKSLIGTNVSTDIIVETPERLEKFKNTIGYVYKTILEEGVVIYE